MRPVVLGSSLRRCRSAIRESSVKQRRRRRLRKRHLEVNLCFLKLSRAYSISSNIGNFFLELSSRGLYQSSGKEKESCCLVFPSSTGTQEARRSRAETAKKCTKKRDARAKLLFYQSKPIAFLPFSLTSPSSLLKLPFGLVSFSFLKRRIVIDFDAMVAISIDLPDQRYKRGLFVNLYTILSYYIKRL